MIPSAALLCIPFALAIYKIGTIELKPARAIVFGGMLATSLVSYYFPVSGQRVAWRDKTAGLWPSDNSVDSWYGSIDAFLLVGYYQNYGRRLIWPSAGDTNQQLDASAKHALQITDGQIKFDDLCHAGDKQVLLFVLLNPLSNPAEVAEDNRILGRYPNRLVRTFYDNELELGRVYLVNSCEGQP
jgi:hypothetical protein